MQPITRRRFIQSTAATAGALSLMPTYSKVLGANEDIRVALIGFNSRGRALLGQFEGVEGVRVTALCDVDERVLASQASSRPGVFTTTDLREILDRDDVDAVVSATPNHWHALLTIWACQAGKDVYIEKPVSHNLWEGVQMTAAARKYGRVVQSGMQNRSDTACIEFFNDLHSGMYGRVRRMRAMCCKTRSSIGKRDTPMQVPGHINYDMWLGPAADEPIYRNNLHYDWHWMWNTGNSDIGNQGPHELDLLRWAVNDPMDYPTNVQCFGGRFKWNDAGETPNVQVAMFDYAGVPCVHETCDIPYPHPDNADRNVAYDKDGVTVGVMITCEEGEFRGGRGGGVVVDRGGDVIKRYRGGSGDRHVRNFIDAMRANVPSMLTSEVGTAAVSAGMAHVSNIAWRVGAEMTLPEVEQSLGTIDLHREALDRFSTYLGERGVDLAQQPWVCGPKLVFDSEAMQFTGPMDDAANALVRREYREGFAVPEEV
ncbi:MAG: Gfo/Idh/MocA family protein [Phycisphaerales bacterium JB063]